MKRGQDLPPTLSISRVNYSEPELGEGEINLLRSNELQRIKYVTNKQNK